MTAAPDGNAAHGKGVRPVGASQRERLIDAMIDVTGARGFGSASVARVSLAAGVSSATFYELFKDREDCLLAAYRMLAAGLRDHAEPPAPRPAPTVRAWCGEARSAIEGTLGVLERDPNGARVLLFEALAAGGALAGERALTEEALCGAHARCSRAPRLLRRLLDLPAVALVGAIRSVVARRLLAGEQLDAPRAGGGPGRLGALLRQA